MEPGGSTNVALAEFLSNPDIHYYDFHELHNGEVVEVPPPSVAHVYLQVRIERLFRSLLPEDSTVLREFYFTLPTEARRADVAVVSNARWNAEPDKVFFGSPGIMVEILSRSNLAVDLVHLRRACLTADAEQFWVVDPFEKIVAVFHRDGSWKEYSCEQQAAINFEFAGRDYQLPVRAIFD